MNKLTRVFVVIVAMAAGATQSVLAKEATDDAGIRRAIRSYEQALDGNSVEGIVRLFAEDGVAMIQGSPTHIGAAALRTFYAALFKALDFELEFEIAEVVQMSSEWAFVRCTSHGKVAILSNSSTSQSAGQEMFILKKQADGGWKIARYVGSSTK